MGDPKDDLTEEEDHLVDALTDEYLRKRAEGQNPDIDKYLARFPNDRLRMAFRGAISVDGLMRAIGSLEDDNKED